MPKLVILQNKKSSIHLWNIFEFLCCRSTYWYYYITVCIILVVLKLMWTYFWLSLKMWLLILKIWFNFAAISRLKEPTNRDLVWRRHWTSRLAKRDWAQCPCRSESWQPARRYFWDRQCHAPIHWLVSKHRNWEEVYWTKKKVVVVLTRMVLGT